MPRKPRTLLAGEFYHLVTRAPEGVRLFREPEDYDRFMVLLGEGCRRYRVKLFHYSLMASHAHLVVRCDDSETGIAGLMRRVQSLYARYFNSRHASSGAVFEDRYKSVHIEDGDLLLECGRYVERAPVRAGEVGDPADWPWSSFRYYGTGVPDPLLTINPLYARMAYHLPHRRSRYEKYVSAPRAYEEITSRFFDRVLFSSSVL